MSGMGLPGFVYRMVPVLFGGGGGKAPLRYQYQVATTAPAQTTTPKYTFGAGAPAALVDWGDGSARTAVVSGVELSHAYAAAGTYTVTLVMDQQEVYLTGIDIGSDRAVGDLWAENIDRFAEITDFRMYANTGLTGIISLANFPRKITYLNLRNTQVATTGSLADLPPTLLQIYLHATQSVITGGDMPIAATGIRDIRVDGNGWSQAQVDSIIDRIYQDRMLFTYAAPIMNIGGTNATPSGVYQDATPPTTGKEMIYKLVNDPDGEGFNKWAIVYTA